MKLQHLIYVVFFVSGCAAPGSWNTLNPLATNQRPAAQQLDKKSQSQLSLARLSERHGQAKAAEGIYKGILQKYPNNQTANHRLGVVYAKQSQFKIAAHHFRKAMEIGPLTPELLTDAGYLYYLQDRIAAAEQTYRRALELNPNYKPAHNNLGVALGEQSKYDESLNHFRLAVGDAHAIANVAFIQSQMGDEEVATQNYHRALALDPSIKPAAEALVQLTGSRPVISNNSQVKRASFATNSQQPRQTGQGRPTRRQDLTRNPAPNSPETPRRTGPSGYTVTDEGITRQSIANSIRGQNWQLPTWSPTNDQAAQPRTR